MSRSPNMLIIGVTSRALFDLEAEHKIFQEKGFNAYRNYQIENLNKVLKPGVAFPFISRLLKLNKRFNKEVVKVAIISKNSPETGQRVFNSCHALNLPIQMGAFTSGQSSVNVSAALGVHLFLSANRETIDEAIRLNKPAGLVMQSSYEQTDESEDTALRIAFDFDGVIADDESEREYQKFGLEWFNQYEQANAQTPHSPGPLAQLFQHLSDLQKYEMEEWGDNPKPFKPSFRIAIITSRGATSGLRLFTTLEKQLGMTAVELYMLDGADKTVLLNYLKPHIFFDDQYLHLKNAKVPSVLVPFGIHKKQIDG